MFIYVWPSSILHKKKALVKILEAIVFLQYSKRNERNDKGEPDPSKKNPPYLHEYSNFYIKIVPSLDFSIPSMKSPAPKVQERVTQNKNNKIHVTSL